MSSNIKNIEFICTATQTILRGRFVFPGISTPSARIPLITMLTGDGPKGTKSSSWTKLPSRFAERGIATFLFDYEGLGFSDGSRAELTLTKAIQNFRSAFSLASGQPWADASRLALFGSSFGATVSLLAPEITNRVKLLGLKSPASFLAQAYINECPSGGLDEWLNTGLSKTGYKIEVLKDSLNYNVFKSAREIKTPILITHGAKDTIVPIYQTKLLCSCLTARYNLEVFEDAGHDYSEGDTWERMASTFGEWFSKEL
jgi:dipeptidyl aminopeptidase/acylaminoacyl peptidase